MSDPVAVLWSILAWSAALLFGAWAVAQGLAALDALRRGETGPDPSDPGDRGPAG